MKKDNYAIMTIQKLVYIAKNYVTCKTYKSTVLRKTNWYNYLCIHPPLSTVVHFWPDILHKNFCFQETLFSSFEVSLIFRQGLGYFELGAGIASYAGYVVFLLVSSFDFLHNKGSPTEIHVKEVRAGMEGILLFLYNIVAALLWYM